MSNQTITSRQFWGIVAVMYVVILALVILTLR